MTGCLSEGPARLTAPGCTLACHPRVAAERPTRHGSGHTAPAHSALPKGAGAWALLHRSAHAAWRSRGVHAKARCSQAPAVRLECWRGLL